MDTNHTNMELMVKKGIERALPSHYDISVNKNKIFSDKISSFLDLPKDIHALIISAYVFSNVDKNYGQHYPRIKLERRVNVFANVDKGLADIVKKRRIFILDKAYVDLFNSEILSLSTLVGSSSDEAIGFLKRNGNKLEKFCLIDAIFFLAYDKPLTLCTNLTKFYLKNYAVAPTEHFLEILSYPSLNTLTDLSCIYACLNDNWISMISKFNYATNLVSLNLSYNRIKDAAMFGQSTRFMQLTSLNLASNRIGSDVLRLWEQTSNLPNLKILDLSDNGLGPMDVQSLSQCPFPLQELYLEGLNPRGIRGRLLHEIGDVGLQYVCESEYFTGLTILNVASNAITPDGAQYLTKLSNLKVLNLNDNQINCTNAIIQLENLTSLNLNENPLNAQAIQNLACSKNMNKLKVLALNNNSLGDESLKPLAQSTNLTSLKRLYLRNLLRHTSLGDLPDPGAIYLDFSPDIPHLDAFKRFEVLQSCSLLNSSGHSISSEIGW